MSDVKLREALEFVEAVRDTFSDDLSKGFITRDKQYAVYLLSEALDLAAEALAQPAEAVELTGEELIMSESKYRKALESIAANTCCGPCQEAALVAREALAQPAEVAGLTSHELYKAYDNGVSKAIDDGTASISHLYGLKYVIAAHEAKKNGGGV